MLPTISDAEAGDGETDSGDVGQLEPGSLLAERYEILRLLGQGGMGAVYQARDRELDRIVALKTMRPELAQKANIVQRFKQEVILTSQVTHPNVIRIFDFGSAGRLRFLTMEYVEGQDLEQVLKARRLDFEEACRLIRQVCLGLEAAHARGVVHRDLKPQNIRIDPKGRVAVMDFGLAFHMESSGLTRAGMILGTPDYMSPEQAMGQRGDQRSDVYAIGVILFQMLTGKVPFESNTVVGALVARTREPAQPPVEVNPNVPAVLNAIVVRCLMTDPAARYGSVSEILGDLDGYLGSPPSRSLSATTVASAQPLVPSLAASRTPPAPDQAGRRKWIAAAVAGVVLLAAGGLGAWRYFSSSRPAGPLKPVSILVTDLVNRTGDAGLDGALEPSLSLALEGASYVNLYNRGAAKRMAAQLQPGAEVLDERLGRLIAIREGIQIVLIGSVSKEGSGYKLLVQAIDGSNGANVTSVEESAGSREKLLSAASHLAVPLRRALGESVSDSDRSDTYTAASLEAAQAFARAQDLRVTGKSEEAIELYKKAIQLDANLGSAYYALASTYSNLGRKEEAKPYWEGALARLDRMTERERRRTRGAYYLIMLNHEKAIEELTQLVKDFPADTGGLSNLAFVYYLRREMPKALEEAKRSVQVYPKVLLYRSNLAMYTMYNSDFSGAEKEARQVLAASPNYLKALGTLAQTLLGQGLPDQAVETYRKMAALPVGESLGTMGLSDVALYQGRIAEAVTLLKEGIAKDSEAKRMASAAKKEAALAEALLLLGRRDEAGAAATRAVAASADFMPSYTAARVFLELGQDARIKPIIEKLSSRLESDPQLYAKLIEGEAALRQKRVRDAVLLFRDAQKLTDTWLGRYCLGRAYLAAESYPEASSEFDVCVRRRGEAVELFLDDSQTYRYYAHLLYYQARTQEALKSPQAKDAYSRFLQVKDQASPEPFVADARQRAKDAQ
ncbi:MAG: protein kinase [Bryobacteraceae bacterium]|nr:protein kinase [Bryobacteraceae bacterium]